MDLTQGNLNTLYTGLQEKLNTGLAQADTSYLKWCSETTSATKIEEYPVMMLTGSMREWVGDRVINNVNAKRMTIINRDFEHTEQIDRNAIEDDKYGVYGVVFQEMGIQAGNLWMELANEALCTPGKWADGNDFYGSRKFGKATIDNSMGAAELTLENYAAARARMMGFLGADGKALRLVPDTLMIGPELEGKARTILEAELIHDGNGTVSNIHKGECEVVLNLGLTGEYAKYWFLMDTKHAAKPFVVQKRKVGPLVRQDREECECVFNDNRNLYGLHYRGASAAVMPHLVIGSFPAAS